MPLSSSQSAECLAKFKAKIVAHPLLKSAFGTVMQFIEEPADVEVIAVIGPTGVGKSTLGARVQQEIIKQNIAAMETNLGLQPVLAVKAPAPETGSFNWREIYLRILVELKEPACDWQVVLRDRQPGKPGVARLSSLNHGDLKRHVESGLRHRGVKVLLIDEGQHLGKMASGRRLQDQTDSLKSLAQSTGTLIILLGTYELIPLLGLNGQVARRVCSVHLPRYRCDDSGEWRNFQTAIRSLQAEITLPKVPDLLPKAEMLYRGSAGCIGILKSWLTVAYSQVLRENGAELTPEVLNATCLPAASLRKIIEEIRNGEDHWMRSHAEDRELDRLLGLLCFSAEQGSTKNSVPAPTTRRVPVGMRNPTRDPIGLEAAVI
jgi:hypothetical protein